METNKPIYLYITPFFPSPESWRGGYCLDAVKAIINDGRYDVRVFVSGNGDDYEWDGVKVLRFRRITAPSGILPFLFCGINNWFFKRKLKQAGINIENVSVCHSNTIVFGHYSSWMKKQNKLSKAIVQFHSSYSLVLRSGRLGLIPIHATFLYLYYRYVCMNVDILAFVSEMSMRTFGKRYVGEPEGQIKDVRTLLWFGRWLPALKLPKQVVIYNGIDRSLFYSDTKPYHRSFIIGCVANFQPLKDHMTLLRAVKIIKNTIPDLRVRLIGTGNTLAECMQYVKYNKLEDIVSFENEIDHRDMPNFYRSLDLFVMPSRLEGFLCVCVESWACGTPSIFCHGTALPELLPRDDWKHWLFKPRDVDDLVCRIVEYYKNRRKQRFLKNLEINSIWKEFLNDL